MDAAIKAAIVLARIQAGRSIGPQRGPGPTPGTPERLAELHGEIRDRPWRLATRHLGDDPSMTEIHRFARVGAQPVGTDANDMNLHFYLPAVRLRCPGPCNSLTTFTALARSGAPTHGR
jgi:hypothetical protein